MPYKSEEQCLMRVFYSLLLPMGYMGRKNSFFGKAYLSYIDVLAFEAYAYSFGAVLGCALLPKLNILMRLLYPVM